MAAPHVAGAAALYASAIRSGRWSSSSRPSRNRGRCRRRAGSRSRATRSGWRCRRASRADLPLLFARPPRSRSACSHAARRGDHGEPRGRGRWSGTWQVGRVVRSAPAGVKLVLPATSMCPALSPSLSRSTRSSKPGDLDAYVELRTRNRREESPVWGRVTVGALARHQLAGLGRPGIYRSTTLRQPAFVSRYRYPENAERGRRHHDVARPGTRFPAATREARRELRRRRHPTRKDEPGGAESRRRARREPADRIRGASRQPQPVHGRVPRRRPRGRRAVARARRLRGRLRQRRARGAGSSRSGTG